MENRRLEISKIFRSWNEYFTYKKSYEWKKEKFKECGVSVMDNGNGESIIIAKYYKIV